MRQWQSKRYSRYANTESLSDKTIETELSKETTSILEDCLKLLEKTSHCYPNEHVRLEQRIRRQLKAK